MSVRIVGLAMFAVLGAACSLVVERGADQCASNADCEQRGQAFRGTVCSPQRTCTSPTSGGGECTTNEQCIAKAGGAAAICRKDNGVCVTLLDADCDSVTSTAATGELLEGADAVRDEDTVIIGSLTSLRGPNGPKGLARRQAVELAVSEVMTRAAGLPPGANSDRRRPVAILSCNDAAEANPPPSDPAPIRSAKHLVDVGAPAVVGAGNSGLTVATVPYLPKKGVLLIAPSATSRSITTQDDDGLLWRTAPSDDLQAIPLADRVMAKAPDDSTGKLAVIYKNDAYGQGLFEKAARRITRNGEPITDQANSSVFMARPYDPTATDLSTLISDVYAFNPNVVAIIGTSEATTELIVPMERGWSGASGPGGARPDYVVSDGLKAAALTTAIANDEAGDSTNLRGRVVGTAPGRPTSTTNAFLLRFEPKYGTSNSTAFGTAGAYDAAYVIMYGLVAAGAAPVSGRSIADGIAKLVGGTTKIDVGPDGVNDAFQKLSAGVGIDLNGASSPLNFDLTTGESPADIEVWCVSPSITTPTFRTSDLYFNAFTQRMTGKFNCN